MGTAIPYLLVCTWFRWATAPHLLHMWVIFFLFPLVLTSSFLFHFSHLDFWFKSWSMEVDPIYQGRSWLQYSFEGYICKIRW
jgi:hypothetical protein